MAPSDSGAVPQRPHHISSIAHLYLQDDPSAGRMDSVGAALDLAVATPGVTPISAFASAGLALAAPGKATLCEDIRLRWSAKTFLPIEDAGRRVQIHQGDSHLNKWSVAPVPAPAPIDGAGGRNSPAPGPIQWNHLGCLGPAEMAHLESLAAVGSVAQRPLAGSGGLIWCLLARDAGRLGPGYLLGRLVELIQPARIAILVFPDAWSQAGRPGWLEAIEEYEFFPGASDILIQCKELAELVCDPIPSDIFPVEGSDNLAHGFSGSPARETLWPRLVSQLLADSAGC